MRDLKQRYPRTYPGGRSTAGWGKGERISSLEQLKPGDVLIMVSHRFPADNLIRVTGTRPGCVSVGFDYEYTDNKTGEKYGPEEMFCWHYELQQNHKEFYRAIDMRPKDRSRMRIRNLPAWLSYAN